VGDKGKREKEKKKKKAGKFFTFTAGGQAGDASAHWQNEFSHFVEFLGWSMNLNLKHESGGLCLDRDLENKMFGSF
jgi:hypothetical protein